MQMEFLYDVPDVLYKFRDWDNGNSHNLLFRRQFFFSSYARFNDPFDGGIPFQYRPEELTPENIFKKYYESAKQMYINQLSKSFTWQYLKPHLDCYI